MTEEEVQSLIIGACYFKHAIPAPVHLKSLSGTDISDAALLKAGHDLVALGYLKQQKLSAEFTENIDAIVNDCELTPDGVEKFEGFLKKERGELTFGIAEMGTVIIQLPWFGGRASAKVVNTTETTAVTLKVALGDMIEQIDNSGAPAEHKVEAKSKLKEFLKHPLVVAIAGEALKPLLENL